MSDIVKVRSPLLLIGLSLAVFIFCDTLIFRSGFYGHYLKPNFVGTLVYEMHREHKRKPESKKNLLIMGNSQIEWGFSVKQFEEAYPNAPIKLIRMDAPSTHEETWYYTLKTIDPDHNKYSAILIPLPDYKIEPDRVDQQNNYETATFLATFLKLRDWPHVIEGYSDPSTRYRVAILALFPSHNYSLDLQDFITHPVKRAKDNRSIRRDGEGWRHFSDGRVGAWQDMKIQSDGTVGACPSTYDHFECVNASNMMNPISPEEVEHNTARNQAFQQQWIGKIIDLYKGSQTRLIFVQMPRWPVPFPSRVPLPGAADIRDLVPQEPNVIFLDDHLFTSLETPAYMHDAVHLDLAGREIFTQELGAQIMRLEKDFVVPSQMVAKPPTKD